jgi:hypothetical protein
MELDINWDALGAIGEIVGAAAVVLTLAYLAMQIRQNTRTVKAASHHAITDSMNHISISIAQNPDVARIWRMGNEDLSSLTEDEFVSFGFLLLTYMRVFETLYYQRKIGTMEEQLYIAEEKTLRWAVKNPGFRSWWVDNPISLSQEFRDYIDRLIREETAA